MRTTNGSLTKSSSSFSSGATPPTRFKLNIKRREQQTPYCASSAISSSTIEAPIFSPVLAISLEEEEELGAAAEQKKDDSIIKTEVTKKAAAAAAKKSKN